MMRYQVLSVVGFLLTMGFSPSVAIASEPGDQVRFDFPQVLALELVISSETSRFRQIVGTLEARIGTARNVEVFFDVPPGWRVTPDQVTIPAVFPGERRDVRVVLAPPDPLPPGTPAWIMMRAAYLPEYLAILKVVKDPGRYPDPLERSRLLSIVRRNFQAQARQTDGVRIDLGPARPAQTETQGAKP